MSQLAQEKNQYITKTNLLCAKAEKVGENIREGVGQNIKKHFWVSDPIIDL